VHLGDGAPCVSVGQALTRLGLQHSVQLMRFFLLRHALPVRNSALQRFWERSQKRALAMQFLAQRVPGLPADLAGSHGLFCHVGMPVMLQQLRGYGATLVEAAARIDRPFVATEDANHRSNHAVVGALTVRVWGLPRTLMASVRLHHDFSVINDRGIEPDVALLVACRPGGRAADAPARALGTRRRLAAARRSGTRMAAAGPHHRAGMGRSARAPARRDHLMTA
jgi:HD-like signal output (HDOD) protein